MVVMSSRKTSSKNRFIEAASRAFPDVLLEAGDSFLWSPADNKVMYDETKLSKANGKWSLLHELAHAKLGHQIYKTDFELLSLELAAWDEAKQLAPQFDTVIDDNYVEDCLDTYRDWLHLRSTCPMCGSGGLQHSSREYRCHNCHSTWQVSTSRFCRPYRMKQKVHPIKKSPDHLDQTTFM